MNPNDLNIRSAAAGVDLSGHGACGLVLGGGGARGLAGIGVMEELQKAGLRVAAVAGTSMGALLGAFLARGYTAAEVHEIVSGVRWTDVLDLSVAGGIIRGQRFGRWLEEYLPADFADLEMPLTVTATDIDTGEQLLLRDGELIPALRATCAFPGAFAPVRHAGRNLVDGGLLVTVPISGLEGCGVETDFVVACDFGPPRDRRVVEPDIAGGRPAWDKFWKSLTFRRRNLAADILLKAVDIMQADMCARHLAEHRPDMLIRPLMPAINMEDFRRSEEIVQAGAAAARAALADFAAAGRGAEPR